MVEITDIIDRDSYREWLEEADLPRDVLVALAFRSAARVLPIWWAATLTNARLRDSGLTALPILRSLLTSLSFAVAEDTDVKSRLTDAAYGASAAASSIASSAASASLSDSSHSDADSGAAAFAAYAASDTVSDTASAVSAASAASAAASADTAAALWSGLRQDLVELGTVDQILSRPLRMSNSPNDDLQSIWQSVNATLEDSRDDSWRFWLDWYERILHGEEDRRTLLIDIALSEDIDWSDTTAALQQINKLADGYISNPAEYGPVRSLIEDLQTATERAENASKDLQKTIVDITSAEKSRRSVARTLTQVKDAVGDANQLIGEITSAQAQQEPITQNLQSVEASLKEMETAIATTTENQTSAMAALAKAMESEYALNGNLRLWQAKRKLHNAAATAAKRLFYVALFVLGVAVVSVVTYLVLHGFPDTLRPIGCDPATASDACRGIGAGATVALTATLTLLTLGLWFARLQMKEYLSQRHLALDAQERHAFLQAYVGLIAAGHLKIDKEASRQVEIIFEALFRPSQDGIVREEGGIDPSISSALSRLVSR